MIHIIMITHNCVSHNSRLFRLRNPTVDHTCICRSLRAPKRHNRLRRCAALDERLPPLNHTLSRLEPPRRGIPPQRLRQCRRTRPQFLRDVAVVDHLRPGERLAAEDLRQLRWRKRPFGCNIRYVLVYMIPFMIRLTPIAALTI